MGILQKLYGVVRNEGLKGIKLRLDIRLAKTRLKIGTAFNQSYVKSAYGLNLKSNYGDTTFEFYMLGSYGFFYASILQKIDQPFYFLDIGANQGLYAMIAAQNSLCEKSIAFEPVKKTAAILAQNVEANNLTHKIEYIQKAISNENGSAEIMIKTNHSGAASLSQNKGQKFTQSEMVDVINYEGLNELPLDKDIPIYVKIDVEGHEETVLKELFKSRLGEKIVQIFYECDEKWISPAAVEQLLKNNDFKSEQIGDGIHYDVLATQQS